MSRIADLAALLRALHHLRPENDAARASIGRRFGISLAAEAVPAPAAAPATSRAPAPLRRSFADAQLPPTRRERPKPLATSSERLDAERSPPPAWLGARTLPAPVTPPSLTSAGLVRHSLAGEPCLLPDASRRTLLLEMTGTRERTGALDIARLVHQVALGRTVSRLPRRSVRRLPPRIILLLDEGPGMDPFAADQLALAEALRRVAGSDRVVTYCFTESLAEDLREPLGDGAATLRPGPADALVVVSDLGIARQYPAARVSELAQFAAPGRKLVILNPFPPERWPAIAPGGPVILHWHEALRVGDVRRARSGRRAA